MDCNEAVIEAQKMAAALIRRYGLSHQVDATALREDMVQSAIEEFLKADSQNRNLKSALWRGLHNEIRLIIFGRQTKHSLRGAEYSLDRDDLVDDDMSIGDQVDWLRVAGRMRPGSDEYRYFIDNEYMHEIAASVGVTESCMSIRLKSNRARLGLMSTS